MNKEEMSAVKSKRSPNTSYSAFKNMKNYEGAMSGLRNAKQYGTLKEFPSKYYNELKAYRREKSLKKDKQSFEASDNICQSRDSLNIKDFASSRGNSEIRKSIDRGVLKSVEDFENNLYSARTKFTGILDCKRKNLTKEMVNYKSILRKANKENEEDKKILKEKIKASKNSYLQTETSELKKSYHFDSINIAEIKKSLEQREKMLKNRESELEKREKMLMAKEKELKVMKVSKPADDYQGFRSQGHKPFAQGNPLELSDCEAFYKNHMKENNYNESHAKERKSSRTRNEKVNSLEEDLNNLISKRKIEGGKNEHSKSRDGLIRSQSCQRKKNANHHSQSQGKFSTVDEISSEQDFLKTLSSLFKYSGSSITSLEFRIKEQLEELSLYKKFQGNLEKVLDVQETPLKQLWKVIKEKMEQYMILKREKRGRKVDVDHFAKFTSKHSQEQLIEMVKENEIMREIVDMAKSKSSSNYL